MFKDHPLVVPADPYEQKLADFIRMLAETKEEAVLIHHPEVIGDNYDEIVESLNQLADAKKQLVIVPRKNDDPFAKAEGIDRRRGYGFHLC